MRVGRVIKPVVITTALALLSISVQAEAAPTVELAKKCRQLAMKAHPPSLPGTKGGSAQAERDYFAECVRKGGNMDQESPEKK
jgi:hypothetical protein